MATKPVPQSAAFSSALKKFRARLTGPQLEAFAKTNYKSLCVEITRIQSDQETAKRMMNLSRIQSFLEAMNNFSKVIEVFLNASDALAFVWGPIKFLLVTASNWTDSFELLLEAYEHIGEQLPLLSDIEAVFYHKPRTMDALVSMYIDILEFHQHALRFFSGKVWKRLFKAVWKDFDTQFGGILKRLGRHKALIESHAQVDQYIRYQDDMIVMKAQMEELILESRNKKVLAVKEWLASGSQAQIDHDTYVAEKAVYPDTGTWILKQKAIMDWLNADVPLTPVVWVNGIPGAGKTILASVIIEESRKRNGFVTSYFYCHYEGAGSRAVAVFSALLDQIIDQHPLLLPYCHYRFSTSGEKPALRSLPLAKTLLKDFCLTVDKQYIIIDGLDECETTDRKEILEALVALVSDCDAVEPGKLRVLFVSQPFGDIKRVLQASTNTRNWLNTISLSSTDNRDDIMIYVRAWVAQIRGTFDLNDDQARRLQEMTISGADGMFLYAKLVLINLLKQPNRERLFQEIQEERFPKGLEQAYERILSRIQSTAGEAEWQTAKKLLGWMVCAKRQLAWKEMQVALSLDFDSQMVLYDDRRLRRHIHDICGSLVQLSGDRVHLVHSTAKHYITTCSRDIHTPSVECELAAMCLQYLTFPCFGKDTVVDNDTLRAYTLEGQLGFQDYAVAKWYHHVNAFIDSGSALMATGDEAIALMEEMDVALSNFLGIYDEDIWDGRVIDECEKKCRVFQDQNFYDNLIFVSCHIYAFQNKGFDARHDVSIKSLASALERNRKLLEDLPKGMNSSELAVYRQFYDDERRFKCPKITCAYFSEGFKDARTKDRHINLHNRPFHCEVLTCLSAELGFTNLKDLEKHQRTNHPETVDMAEVFRPAGPPRPKSQWTCSICGKSFTRNLHKKDHENSHSGVRPYACPECGKAFTRENDMKRHQKIHDRQNHQNRK